MSDLKQDFKKNNLAEKLKNGEISCDELEDEEIDEMIEFFNKSIKYKDIELENIKREIIKIKTKISN